MGNEGAGNYRRPSNAHEYMRAVSEGEQACVTRAEQGMGR